MANGSVYKYQLGAGPTVIDMPRGAKALHVAMQGGALMLWALVDLDEPKESRTFDVYGTGNATPLDRRYVGTVLNGQWVWHVFEREREK